MICTICLNFLSRLVYLNYIEIAMCATLAISVQMSTMDTFFASIILICLLVIIVGFFILY